VDWQKLLGVSYNATQFEKREFKVRVDDGASSSWLVTSRRVIG